MLARFGEVPHEILTPEGAKLILVFLLFLAHIDSVRGLAHTWLYRKIEIITTRKLRFTRQDNHLVLALINFDSAAGWYIIIYNAGKAGRCPGRNACWR